MIKKITAALLAVILVFTGISLPETAYAASKSAQNNMETENGETAELNNNLAVRGTSSFGSLLEDKLSQEALEQQENQGCNIFSIKMMDKTATVSFETTMDATLVVAVYEEDGVKMLGSAKMDVSAEETQTTVDFNLQEVPQYFYLRGFLVDSENLQPLCISYESPMYTQKMQEFLAKRTDDFKVARVLNLDEDTENNFAVYNEETIRIEKSEMKNQVVKIDDDSKEVVIRLKKKAAGSVVYPASLGGSTKVKEIETSLFHTFALMDDGSLYMWGTNYSYDGDIEFNVLEVISTPVKIMENVSGIETYSYPGKGNLHEYVAILCEDCSLYSMGMDRFQTATENSWTPVKVLDDVSTISLGEGMLGAITGNGDLYTWGSNSNVQQGNGATGINGYSLFKILSNVATINMGDYGSHAAITKDGGLYMWGRNDYGQLGNGTTEYSSVPVKVLDNVVDVTVDPCCSAITTDGSLYTWGTYYNSGGLLGNGTTEKSLVPVKILSNVASLDWIYVGGTWNGYYYTGRAITKNGGLYTWCGNNRHGELGNGTTENSLVPVKILDNVAAVAGSCGAITKDGSLYKWGENTHGELGNGTTEDSLMPVKVLDNVVAVAGNSGAITKDGSLYKWGENYNGSLGTGTTEDSLVPVKVLDNVEFTDGISAITKDGSLYAWGSNNNGRLGNGTTEISLVPVKVLDNVVSVYENSWYPVYSVITKDGSLYMWGRNDYGQLGNGTTEYSLTPLKVNFQSTAVVLCNHTYKDNKTLVKATASKNGTLEQKCSVCGDTKNFTIYAVKGVKISSTSYTYSGKAKKPSVTVTDSKGKILKNNTDYSVSYASGRKNVGSYAVTITLKGRYTGTIKKTFTIKPKSTSISKVSATKKGFTVKWKKQKTQTTGYEIQYSTSSKFKGAKTLKNIKSNITSKKVTKLIAKKKYYVRIRIYKTAKVNGKSTKIYSEWSKAKSVVTKK